MPKQLKALTRLSLRKSADPESPAYNDWHVWEAGQTFTPPKNLDVKRALERGIVEEVSTNG